MTHRIKIQNEYFENLLTGLKKAEIRYNDRDYQVGDILDFTHITVPHYSRNAKHKITHIYSGLGLQEGYVALSVEKENQ